MLFRSVETLRYLYKNQRFYSGKDSLTNRILTLIKYKALIGVRVELSGRLNRRNIASKSLFKVGQRGTLKNIDSSFKGYPVVILRGSQRPNLSYSTFNSKTSNGSFNVKGWTARHYSTSATSETINNIKLRPGFVTGLADGEGCFLTNVQQNNRFKTG